MQMFFLTCVVCWQIYYKNELLRREGSAALFFLFNAVNQGEDIFIKIILKKFLQILHEMCSVQYTCATEFVEISSIVERKC